MIRAHLGDPLTKAELRVLEQASRGLDGTASARESFHAVSTIKFHRHNIFKKMGAINITHAVAMALRQGLID